MERVPRFLRPATPSLDQEIVAQIFLKVRELYKKEGGRFPDPILNLTWPYYRSATSRARRNCQGDQRQGAGGPYRPQDEADVSRPASRFPASAGCAMTEQRPAATGSTPGLGRKKGRNRAPRHRGSIRARNLSELGMVVAGEPPCAVQPGLVRRLGKALGSRAQAGLVE